MLVAEWNPRWVFMVPAASVAILLLYWLAPSPLTVAALCFGLIGAVVAAVHHAEVIAHKVGEPFGTLVLALSVTIIEVALIISMMLSGGPEAMGLPRDTVFAAVMIILNAIIGCSLIVGGLKHREQIFHVEGMTDALGTMAVIVVIALVLPNFLTSSAGPTFSPPQLLFVAAMTLLMFAAFTLFQTMRHREYFAAAVVGEDGQDNGPRPDSGTAMASLMMLLLSLVVVVLSAKGISPSLEVILNRLGAPASVLGIVIATIVLMPEFGAAMRAAAQNRIQASLNLAIGSAIASIGLVIPTVAVLAVVMGWPLELGLDSKSILLLALSLFVVALSLRTGKTNMQPGIIHLLLFAAYLFFSFSP
ncbi:calcium:proton antiporter [Sphingopyxis yananensis]|uniref:calcium:proton antiporter n=1 Tax=Sphingopyxis yananensis TaxID=2886687 RepID=UPI001D0FC581|nr:ionic transporter y4hA [Sphingopyxis yananensis]MCC2602586.1 ionic transporter y4hA [Sphingopyxis yananensis]